jgi:hypothetical protein
VPADPQHPGRGAPDPVFLGEAREQQQGGDEITGLPPAATTSLQFTATAYKADVLIGEVMGWR